MVSFKSDGVIQRVTRNAFLNICQDIYRYFFFRSLPSCFGTNLVCLHASFRHFPSFKKKSQQPHNHPGAAAGTSAGRCITQQRLDTDDGCCGGCHWTASKLGWEYDYGNTGRCGKETMEFFAKQVEGLWKTDLDLTFSMFFAMLANVRYMLLGSAHEENVKCSMIRSWASELAKHDDQTVCS